MRALLRFGTMSSVALVLISCSQRAAILQEKKSAREAREESERERLVSKYSAVVADDKDVFNKYEPLSIDFQEALDDGKPWLVTDVYLKDVIRSETEIKCQLASWPYNTVYDLTCSEEVSNRVRKLEPFASLMAVCQLVAVSRPSVGVSARQETEEYITLDYSMESRDRPFILSGKLLELVVLDE